MNRRSLIGTRVTALVPQEVIGFEAGYKGQYSMEHAERMPCVVDSIKPRTRTVWCRVVGRSTELRGRYVLAPIHELEVRV